MAVYSHRFWLAHDASGDHAVEFTCPANMRAVLRSVDITYGGSGSPSATMLIDTGPTVIAGWSWQILSPGSRSWSGGEVFEAGETVYINASDVMDMIASGYLLTLP